MLTVAIGALTTLLGVILGGATRAWEANHARRKDAEALLSALVAEVEAITRLVNHRAFIPGLLEIQREAIAQVEAGHGSEAANFMVVSLEHDYFTTYKASIYKIGLLHPYWADRITRFYTFAKAVTENYNPKSLFQRGVTAEAVVQITANDLMLLHTLVLLGNHIASDTRKLEPPKGVRNPFAEVDQAAMQPSLPTAEPSLASSEAAASDRMSRSGPPN